MGETTYSVELAKSGRSSCKKCKEKINKGDVRIVTSSQSDAMEYAISSNYHPACFKVPRKFSTGPNKMSVEEFVDEYLTDTTDDGVILPDQKDELVQQIEVAMATPAKKKKAAKNGDGEEDEGLMSKLKKKYEAWKESGADEPPKKKAKKAAAGKNKGGDDDDDVSEMFLAYEDHKGKKLDELKEILRWNKQVLKGTKNFVLFKVIDGQMHGRLGVCGLDGGRLKYDEADGDFKVVCSGQFDEDTNTRIPCDFHAKRGDHKNIPRMIPWYQDQPTEEEQEQMEAEFEKAREAAEGGGASEDNPVASDLLEQAESKFEHWDLTSNKGIKAATSELVELIEGKVDLPENKNAKSLVGPIVVGNQDKTPKEIVKMVIDKFGFAEAKKEKAAKKEAALEAICANPKNAPLLAAFQELAALYFKESNRNAGTSYTKVAAVIKDLDMAITAENALGLGKGKTKIDGIGKSSAEKMAEFMKTGTIQKLEEKREAAQAS